MFSLLPFENKLSVLHASIVRTSNYEEPIKSKVRLCDWPTNCKQWSKKLMCSSCCFPLVYFPRTDCCSKWVLASGGRSRSSANSRSIAKGKSSTAFSKRTNLHAPHSTASPRIKPIGKASCRERVGQDV